MARQSNKFKAIESFSNSTLKEQNICACKLTILQKRISSALLRLLHQIKKKTVNQKSERNQQ